MSTIDIDARLGPTLVDFATNGAFPEEEAVSAAQIADSALPAALRALNDATISLEAEIRQISRESAPDVTVWILHAQKLQDDISESRKLAREIVRQAEADEERLEQLGDAKFQVGFLEKEAKFEIRLLDTLKSVKLASDTLDMVEELGRENKISEALKVLEEARVMILEIPTQKSVTAVKLLLQRWFGLRTSVHEQFVHLWNALVHFDVEERALVILRNLENEETSFDQALLGMKEYNEINEIAHTFWQKLDEVILKPRTDLHRGALPRIVIQNNCLRLSPVLADLTIKDLFLELEDVVRYLTDNLPTDFITALSSAMMPTLYDRIKDLWLDSAVPASLGEMPIYQKTLAYVNDFAVKLDSMKWPGAKSFHDWVNNAPRIWLNKRRETALDWTRNQLSQGVGVAHPTERIETQMVDRHDQVQTNSTVNAVVQDWDAAWASDDEGHRETAASTQDQPLVEESKKNIVFPDPNSSATEYEDPEDAWGWGTDDIEDAEEPAEADTNGEQPSIPIEHELRSPDLRKVTLTEAYCTSSLPRPVFTAVVEIYKDAAILSHPESEHIHVATAAPALFALPTLVLALYRAISPCYYADDPSGNMYLYNDAIWLSDKLRTFAGEWSHRSDLSPRAHGMVKLGPEIKALESFGKRAYSTELNLQRTLITDLLGGTHNFLQQDHTLAHELDICIDSVVQHIRDRNTLWKQILAPSVLASATGSLVNAVASKLITDILDLSDLAVDEAERTARLIHKVTALDDLFLPEVDSRPTVSRNSSYGQNRSSSRPTSVTGKSSGTRNSTDHSDEPPAGLIAMTPKFADKWLKLKFLGEVLQSNLKDIRYFWFESELSLYFTKEEVIDLINLSFENNVLSRQIVRDIRESDKGR